MFVNVIGRLVDRLGGRGTAGSSCGFVDRYPEQNGTIHETLRKEGIQSLLRTRYLFFEIPVERFSKIAAPC